MCAKADVLCDVKSHSATISFCEFLTHCLREYRKKKKGIVKDKKHHGAVDKHQNNGFDH